LHAEPNEVLVFLPDTLVKMVKKSQERKPLPVRDAVPGEQLISRQEQPTLKL
jgi:hypothetical protein